MELTDSQQNFVEIICTKFYAHHSVHRESIPKKFQQDDTLVQYFIISCKSLYMFRVKQSPVIRSSIKLYLQHLVFTNRVWPAVVVDESGLQWNNKILYKSVILELFGNMVYYFVYKVSGHMTWWWPKKEGRNM
jgi:hypothetical protein